METEAILARLEALKPRLGDELYEALRDRVQLVEKLQGEVVIERRWRQRYEMELEDMKQCPKCRGRMLPDLKGYKCARCGYEPKDKTDKTNRTDR